MNDLILGSHVSYKSDEQLLGSVKEALSYGASTLMLYTGAPQNTNRQIIKEDLTIEAHKLMLDNNINIKNLIVHAPYIINPANDKNFDFNVSFLKQEISRVQQLGLSKLVLHPGSHVGLGINEGIKNIIKVLNNSIQKTDNIVICLETMAGKGSEIGYTFEQIKKIIDGTFLKDKIGVCLDTCHINDAGYNINDFDKILDYFDNIIGLDKLFCIHVNDSKNMINTHKDRHENIGYGTLGFENLIKIIYHSKLKSVPKILETPYITGYNSDDKIYPPYKFEIEMILNKKFNPNLLEDIRNYYKNF